MPHNGLCNLRMNPCRSQQRPCGVSQRMKVRETPGLVNVGDTHGL
ncbi:MAG: hypothetical protein ABSH16_06805 [Sedimentisphaerales bacterium]